MGPQRGSVYRQRPAFRCVQLSRRGQRLSVRQNTGTPGDCRTAQCALQYIQFKTKDSDGKPPLLYAFTERRRPVRGVKDSGRGASPEQSPGGNAGPGKPVNARIRMARRAPSKTGGTTKLPFVL